MQKIVSRLSSLQIGIIVLLIAVAVLSITAWRLFVPVPRPMEERLLLSVPFQPGAQGALYAGVSGFVSYSLKTGSTTALSNNLPKGTYAVALSPDAQLLVVAAQSLPVSDASTTPNFSLVRVPTLGGEATTLFTSDARLIPGAVSADGSEIAYVELSPVAMSTRPGPKTQPNRSASGTGRADVYLIPQDSYLSFVGTHEARRVAKNAIPLAFSPDGSMLLALQEGGLIIITVASGDLQQIQMPSQVPLISEDTHVVVAPGGAYMAIFGGQSSQVSVASIDWTGKRLSFAGSVPVAASEAAFALSRMMLLEPVENTSVVLHTYSLLSMNGNSTITPIASHVYPIPPYAHILGWLPFK